MLLFLTELSPAKRSPSLKKRNELNSDQRLFQSTLRQFFFKQHRKPFPRRARATISERDALAQDTEEALKIQAQQAEDRRKESHDLVAQTIRRELAESTFFHSFAAFIADFLGHAEEKEADVNEVDDTDGLDPTAEFEAWRLRELARIKTEKEEELEREEEKEEVERRRALPEERRLKEDLEHAKKLRDEKPKGQQMFLQKYWHKGAFYQVLNFFLFWPLWRIYTLF
jgi:hypothetical protein